MKQFIHGQFLWGILLVPVLVGFTEYTQLAANLTFMMSFVLVGFVMAAALCFLDVADKNLIKDPPTPASHFLIRLLLRSYMVTTIVLSAMLGWFFYSITVVILIVELYCLSVKVKRLRKEQKEKPDPMQSLAEKMNESNYE